jgi:hypothetical protein
MAAAPPRCQVPVASGDYVELGKGVSYEARCRDGNGVGFGSGRVIIHLSVKRSWIEICIRIRTCG